MVVSVQNSPKDHIPTDSAYYIQLMAAKAGGNEVVSVPTFHLRFGLETVNIGKDEPPE